MEVQPKRFCEICDKQLSNADSLKVHYLKVHGLRRDDPLIIRIPKSPRRECKHCLKRVKNPYAHRQFCRGQVPKTKSDKSQESSTENASSDPEAAQSHQPFSPVPLAPSVELMSVAELAEGPPLQLFASDGSEEGNPHDDDKEGR